MTRWRRNQQFIRTTETVATSPGIVTRRQRQKSTTQSLVTPQKNLLRPTKTNTKWMRRTWRNTSVVSTRQKIYSKSRTPRLRLVPRLLLLNLWLTKQPLEQRGGNRNHGSQGTYSHSPMLLASWKSSGERDSPTIHQSPLSLFGWISWSGRSGSAGTISMLGGGRERHRCRESSLKDSLPRKTKGGMNTKSRRTYAT